jgi:hypothetical protein
VTLLASLRLTRCAMGDRTCRVGRVVSLPTYDHGVHLGNEWLIRLPIVQSGGFPADSPRNSGRPFGWWGTALQPLHFQIENRPVNDQSVSNPPSDIPQIKKLESVRKGDLPGNLLGCRYHNTFVSWMNGPKCRRQNIECGLVVYCRAKITVTGTLSRTLSPRCQT